MPNQTINYIRKIIVNIKLQIVPRKVGMDPEGDKNLFVIYIQKKYIK